MCSRGVFQLKKLSLFFCDYGGSSSGVRELISSPKLKDFLTSNPQIQLEVICKRNNHPHVKGYFVNGYRKDMPLRSLNQQQTLQSLNSLKNQLGRKAFTVNGPRVHGSKKSIQGKWIPNLFNKYPVGQLSMTYKIPDVPIEKIQKQDPQRDVSDKDITNYVSNVRSFIDPHREQS